MLLFAAEYWSITEEYTTYFEISSIYDWVFLFVGAIRIVHLLVRASSVSSKNVPRNGVLIVLLHYMYLRYCMLPAILTEFCSWLTCGWLDVGLQTMSSAQPSRYGYGNWEEQSLLWMREQVES
jgi:hypothetical protein